MLNINYNNIINNINKLDVSGIVTSININNNSINILCEGYDYYYCSLYINLFSEYNNNFNLELNTIDGLRYITIKK